MQRIDSKEVLTVDSFLNCKRLCQNANSITGHATFEVVPASLSSINKYGETYQKKNIFTVRSIEELREAESCCYFGDGHETQDAVEDWRPRSVKDKVAEYLAKFQKKPSKSIKKKKR